jgi:PAS domain S-box-containing protein
MSLLAQDDSNRNSGARKGCVPPIAGETRARVLVVDDDESALRAMEKLLCLAGFAVCAVADGEAALAEANRLRPDIVLTDLHMPGIDGAELCRRLRQSAPDIPVVVMTASSDIQGAVASLRAGAEDYLVKPLEYDVVSLCVDRALSRRNAKLAHDKLRRHTEALYRTLNARLVVSQAREQQRANAEAQQHAQLNALLENLSEGVVVVEASGRLLMLNEAARRILELGNEGLSTAGALQSLEAYDLGQQPLSQEQHPLSRALRGEEFKDYEVCYKHSGAAWRRVASTGTCVRDASGAVALAIVMLRDLTELRRVEKQRDEYLALISHDLRSPLNNIHLCVTMLKNDAAEKGLAACASLAERAELNVQRTMDMIDELTDSTRLELQGVPSGREPCDLRLLATAVVSRMDDAQARRITIAADSAGSYVIQAQPSGLDRVIANLLTNALKYSAEDSPVFVRLACNENAVELDVTDRGIGIAPDSLKMLFDRYYRTPAGKANANGLGLGLYIVRLTVEAYGGRVRVLSEVGKGSTFRVSFPVHS